MKQLTVKENDKDVYVQTLENNKIVCPGNESYLDYSKYFGELLKTLEPICDEINLVLNVTDESTLMTLYLTDSQLEKTELIKETLLSAFPEDIEQVGISKTDNHELNILDFMFELNS